MRKLLILLILLSSQQAFSQDDLGDQLIKSTVRIVNVKMNDSAIVGTGFFFSYNPDTSWHSRIEAIVTNRHMLKDARKLIFGFRSQSIQNGKEVDSIRSYTLDDPEKWVAFHPDSTIDLCIIFLKPITQYFLKTFHETLNIKYFTKDFIPDSSALISFSSIEDVLMIG